MYTKKPRTLFSRSLFLIVSTPEVLKNLNFCKLLMRPRQKIIEMFSTFVELEVDRFSKWLIDIKLHRNIQNCLEYSPFVPNSENFWAL